MVLRNVLRSFLVILGGLWVVLPVLAEKPSVAKPATPPVVPTSIAVFGLGGAVSESPGGGDLSSLLSGADLADCRPERDFGTPVFKISG